MQVLIERERRLTTKNGYSQLIISNQALFLDRIGVEIPWPMLPLRETSWMKWRFVSAGSNLTAKAAICKNRELFRRRS